MAEIRYWLWLRNLPGLNNRVCLKLWKHFGSPEHIYYADAEEYLHVGELTRAQIKALENKNMERAERIMEACDGLGIRIITIMDAEYPDRLRAISDAPCLLYVKGSWPDFDSEAAIALIGSRESTPYGIRTARSLGYELARGGAYIVSGLAAGGDAAAHYGALLAGKRTAAVLGGGIDVIYPAENYRMYDDILADGVLISEYPPGTPTLGKHFLERNRIISGLSVGVIVVEAKLRSGTQNTVHHALDQGRDVYAVPGPIDSAYSAGTNRMIQEGALIVTCAYDVLRDLQIRFPNRIEARMFEIPPVLQRTERTKVSATEAPKEQPAAPEEPDAAEIDNAAEKEYIKIANAKRRFTDDQIQILLILSNNPMIVDDIAEATQIPIRRVLSALTMLEIDALVQQKSGNRYVLNAIIEK